MAYDTKSIHVQSEKALRPSSSALSTISSSTALSISDEPFTVASSLHINTRGIRLLRLPLPSSELQIRVHQPDGSVAYTSTRAKKCSGDCILTDAHENPLVSTKYFWGPGRDPVLHFHDGKGHAGAEVEWKKEDGSEVAANTVKTSSKWTSRAQTFILPDGRTFEWLYERGHAPDVGGKEKKITYLVLYRKDGVEGRGKKVARLVRDDETRAEGSSKTSAGNGGELQLAADAENEMEEAGIVATCLLMLKKEVDRRQTIQAMVLAGVASNGG